MIAKPIDHHGAVSGFIRPINLQIILPIDIAKR